VRLLDLNEELLPSSRRLKRKLKVNFSFAFPQILKQRAQRDGIGTETPRLTIWCDERPSLLITVHRG